ncbi:MAG: DegT/DnrJ/EryC1/StrS family aminotransferase [Acidobacteriaceae bacterium]|nr:DegT/DnrJ/EryC1/StrS family aminotransferase [Acidobacteriaceae bacterium]
MAIPFLDLGAEYDSIRSQIDDAIRRTIDQKQFILGREVEAFEQEFARYCGARFAAGVNSGTSALHLALLALDIGPGDEVITVPFTFFATVATILYVGATPVLVDIDDRTFNIDAGQIEANITPRTKAILPVHLFGQPANMDAVLQIARKHGLSVIEDAAQAHGAEYRDRPVGTIGDVGCFSFYPTKNLGAPGEGGMVVTNDPEIDRKVRMLRDWGQEQKYYPLLRGYNYRLQGLQAAVLRVKLRELEKWTQARIANAKRYDQMLNASALRLPEVSPEARHVYHLYTVRSANRDDLQQQLKARGIGSAIHYPAPIHLLPAYSDPRYREGDFPVAEACSKSVLSLPVHPFLTPDQLEEVACAVVRASA